MREMHLHFAAFVVLVWTLSLQLYLQRLLPSSGFDLSLLGLVQMLIQMMSLHLRDGAAGYAHPLLYLPVKISNCDGRHQDHLQWIQLQEPMHYLRTHLQESGWSDASLYPER